MLEQIVLDQLILFIAVGFAAQMVDGAAGMAYGVTATTVLLSVGVPPATASATTHIAEVFTTGTSGISHWRMKNVRFNLVWKLALPGMVGGALGAYVLSNVDATVIRPFISAYLLLMGIIIIAKALKGFAPEKPVEKFIVPLGFFGGALDAMGGGGWGPIVASNLLGRGEPPRFAIGSVNLAEFFVTATISAVFITTLEIESGFLTMILGLIIGGVIAAPLAAYVAKIMPARALLVLVGGVVILLSLRDIIRAIS
jgi:uncharacterized membrane protein YfcA